MASMKLSSRFGALRVDDVDSDDDGKADTVNSKEKEAKVAAEAAKKKNKKKKKAQQQSSSKAELRDMTFNKIASVPKALSVPPPKPSVVHPEVLQIGSPPKPGKDWDQWQERDQTFVDNQFMTDMQRAILQSKLEFERREKFLKEIGVAAEAMEEEPESPKPHLNRKERRKLLHGKDKPHAMSLQEFHQDVRGTGDGGLDVGLDVIDLPPEPKPPEEKEILSSVKEEIQKALAKEKKKSRKKTESESSQKMNGEIDGARQAQYQDELEKKDAEITQLQETVDKLKAELAQVKKRNKQLCFIIGQGEMKDKAAVITQVEELTKEKDDLATEVSELYAALEQEKSKVHSLKSELQKLHDKEKKK